MIRALCFLFLVGMVAALEFVPKILTQAKQDPSQLYASKLSVAVPWKKGDLQLDLTLNTQLLDENWFLRYIDETTNEEVIDYDAAKYSCHYSGRVRGSRDSWVRMSLCDAIGMQGVISDMGKLLEVQHSAENSKVNNSSVKMIKQVHQISEVDKDDSISFLSPILPPAQPEFRIQNVSEFSSKQSTYTLRSVYATARDRMNEFGNRVDAESQDTQSLVNMAQSMYSNTVWANSARINIRIRSQDQNPLGWSDTTSLESLASYKRSQYPNAGNVVGLVANGYGGGGLAFVGNMCAKGCAAANNVNLRKQRSAAAGIIAHEIGHNFGLAHDASCDPLFVMCERTSPDFKRFSPGSIREMANRIGGFACLR